MLRGDGHDEIGLHIDSRRVDREIDSQIAGCNRKGELVDTYVLGHIGIENRAPKIASGAGVCRIYNIPDHKLKGCVLFDRVVNREAPTDAHHPIGDAAGKGGA